MPHLSRIVSVFLISYLAACASPVNKSTENIDVGFCGDDDGHDQTQWVFTSDLPDQVGEIRSLLEQNPIFPGDNSYNLETWFRSNINQNILICRSDELPNNSCTGQWWIVDSNAKDLEIIDSNGWICFADSRRSRT